MDDDDVETSNKKKNDDPEMMMLGSASSPSSSSTITTTSSLTPLGLNGRTAGIEDYAEHYLNVGIQKLEESGKTYFSNLDTKTFLRRLVTSVVPKASHRALSEERPDFYGPLVLSFTLSLMLRLAQKSHHHRLASSDSSSLLLTTPDHLSPLNANLTTSILISFGSLIAASLALDVAWQYFVARERQQPVGVLSSAPGLEYALFHVGYSFFGPSIVVFLDGRVHWLVFLAAFATFGLGSSFCLGLAAFRGCGRRRGLVLGSLVFLFHSAWLLLLRRSYRW